MPSTELTPQEIRLLLQTARESIAHGLAQGVALSVDVKSYPAALQQPGASFVTLQKNARLRGCIGTLSVHRPLIEDVAAHAFAAAFADPRFPALQENELPQLRISISLLSPAQALNFSSEADLLRQLKPGKDGLILQHGSHRGTFLPSVWEQLPQPAEFVRQLKRKAGLPADWWQADVQISRYSTLLLQEPVTG